ncbi:hypothetical protein AVEN_98905-1 [Araneus ventricosus]|uniref:Uncharacterized protein n=1 Tax=Araneus ventricosus TaxID=182803 RepID=A0A4Y2FU63_ARAVE|nr:hypothetical protein AVEN_98905-1 [Araneus ventricosus]
MVNTASGLSRQLSSATGTTVPRQTVYDAWGIGLYARRPVRCVLPLTVAWKIAGVESVKFVDTATVVLCDVSNESGLVCNLILV